VVDADLDDFQLAPYTVAAPRALNIEDLLFRYGVRINPNLVLDLYCTQIPIIESIGGNPQPKLYPWAFYPIAIGNGKHPIVKNLDPVQLRFCSNIDTLANPGVQKTILLTTSTYSRIIATPFQIFLEGARQRPDPSLFDKKEVPLAVLLEGQFRSFYQNQYTGDLQQVLAASGITFKAKSGNNKMIVVADGDVASNDIDSKNVPLPLGYDKFTRQQFSNKDFLLNCVEYLIDDNGLIEARNREISMRLLDKAQIADKKSLWQVINIAVPLLLTGLFILGYNSRRKKRYAG
jgi:gliding-associated putative ABC transporter substrate-binding component GldG